MVLYSIWLCNLVIVVFECIGRIYIGVIGVSYIICFGCMHTSVPHVNYFPLVLYKRAALPSFKRFWCIAFIITFCYSVPVNLCEISAASLSVTLE